MEDRRAMARDMSAKRKFKRENGNGTYMFSVRIPEPLRTEFEQFCTRNGMAPSDVMRTALTRYIRTSKRY